MSEIPSTHISEKAKQLIAESYETNDVSIFEVGGGYSLNRRAIVQVGAESIFLKEVDTELLQDDGEKELAWLKKDFKVVEALRVYAPDIVPEWSQLTMDEHLYIMPAYKAEDGWLWSVPSDSDAQKRYIDAVIEATKKIESLELPSEFTEELALQPFFRDELAHDTSYERILNDPALRASIIDKYTELLRGPVSHLTPLYETVIQTVSNTGLLQDLQFEAKKLAEQPNDRFNHCDVRSDNLAFNERTGDIKFVDWNWASYAPEKFGSTEFLCDMARRGIDVSPWLEELNPQLLAAVFGMWITKTLKPPLSPTSTVRQMQAETGAVSLHLFNRLSIQNK